jgi:hypothetical protein
VKRPLAIALLVLAVPYLAVRQATPTKTAPKSSSAARQDPGSDDPEGVNCYARRMEVEND